MKEFVLCLCLLFMQFEDPEGSIVKSVVLNDTVIQETSIDTLLNPSDEKINDTKEYFLYQFESLEREIQAKSFKSFLPLDYFFYESVIHLKKESYKNPDPDYYSEYTHRLIPKCEKHNNEICVIWYKNTHQFHNHLDDEDSEVARSTLSEMEKEKKDLIPFDIDYILEKRGDEFVFYPKNPFAYAFYRKKIEYIRTLKKS